MDGMIVHGTRFSHRLAKKYNISTETTAPFFEGVFQDCVIGKADLKEELKGKLAGKISGTEVALSIASGDGKEHMALISALLSIPVGVRFTALTKDGIIMF